MACGCNGTAAAEKYEVRGNDGTVKTFTSRPAATVWASQHGGMVTKKS